MQEGNLKNNKRRESMSEGYKIPFDVLEELLDRIVRLDIYDIFQVKDPNMKYPLFDDDKKLIKKLDKLINDIENLKEYIGEMELDPDRN